MCTVRQPWTSVAQTTLNYYLHHTQFLVQVPDGTGETILIRKGVTQWDPLGMVAYGLSVLTLKHHLQEVFTHFYHTWYINDSVSGGWFYHI